MEKGIPKCQRRFIIYQKDLPYRAKPEISSKYSHLNPATNLKLPRFDDDTDDIVEEKDIVNDDEMTKFIVKCQEPSSPVTADVITAICLLC